MRELLIKLEEWEHLCRKYYKRGRPVVSSVEYDIIAEAAIRVRELEKIEERCNWLQREHNKLIGYTKQLEEVCEIYADPEHEYHI